MGTRALVVIKNEDDEIVVIYRQFDGYPEGLGQEIVDMLMGKKILNGFGNETLDVAFNGVECLAAYVVHKLKDRVGNVYLYPAGTRNMGEEYVYYVTAKEGDAQATIKVMRCSYLNGKTVEVAESARYLLKN